MEPRYSILSKLLDSGFQLSFMQIEIVNCANAEYAHSGEAGADAVHERAARGTEIISHVVSRADGLRLAVGRQVTAAALVNQVGIVDGEIGCEHGSCNFSAIGAVANKSVDKPRPLN
jgi:hypothetical protein